MNLVLYDVQALVYQKEFLGKINGALKELDEPTYASCT